MSQRQSSSSDHDCAHTHTLTHTSGLQHACVLTLWKSSKSLALGWWMVQMMVLPP